MKRLLAILCCAALLLPLSGCAAPSPAPGAADKTLNVYASFYPMGDFARKIGGEHVSVTVMVPSGAEPHDWEPTVGDIAGLERADVFIYSGAGMEHWVQDVLSSLQNDTFVAVEASGGIELLGGQSQSDPHVWLNPLYALLEMENIKNAFVQADPSHKESYETNFARCSDELKALDADYRDALGGLANKEIIVSHQAFGYLCAAYGLEQIAIEGLTPDSEPSPARVAELIDLAKEHGISVIFYEELDSSAVAETVADAAKARTESLATLEGLNDAQRQSGADYFSIMRENLAKLKDALDPAARTAQ